MNTLNPFRVPGDIAHCCLPHISCGAIDLKPRCGLNQDILKLKS